jgi:hypothetical protein
VSSRPVLERHDGRQVKNMCRTCAGRVRESRGLHQIHAALLHCQSLLGLTTS